MPVRLVLTEGTVADCTQALTLTADFPAQYLLADRGYDTNAIVAGAVEQGDGTGDTAEEPPERTPVLRPGFIPTASFGGECILELQTMEGGGDSLRQKNRLIPRHLPDSSTGPLDQAILTTLSSVWTVRPDHRINGDGIKARQTPSKEHRVVPLVFPRSGIAWIRCRLRRRLDNLWTSRLAAGRKCNNRVSDRAGHDNRIRDAV